MTVRNGTHRGSSERPPAEVRRQGFTVIELLAASALATAMMVLVLGVVSSLSAQHRKLKDSPSLAWRESLIDQLRWDLTNSEYLRSFVGAASLRGMAGSDWTSGVPNHRPVEIFYFLTTIGERTWLVRRETHLDELTQENVREELVCAGMAEFSLRAPIASAGLSTQGLAVPLTDYAVVRLVDDRGEVLVDEVIRWR